MSTSTCTVSNLFEPIQSASAHNVMLHIVTVINLPFHIFYGYCILYKTPTQMVSMKWALLHYHLTTVALDIALGFFLIPMLAVPLLAFQFLGVLSEIGLDGHFQTQLLMFAAMVCAISCVGIFETRFYCLFGRNTFWEQWRRVWLLFHYVLLNVIWIPAIVDFPEQSSARTYVFSKLPCLPEWLRDESTFILAAERGYVFGYFLLVPISAEELFFASLSIVKLWLNKPNLSKSTLKAQKKFTFALIHQVCITFFIVLAPFVVAIICIWTRHHDQGLSNLMVAICTMHGLVASLSAIMLHRPYKEALLEFLHFPKKSPVIFISASQVTLS